MKRRGDRAVEILGLFPAFEAGGFGGIQSSGREAWRSITGRGVRAEAFQYVPGSSKLAAAGRAARMRTDADTVLVWHAGLLKLAPVIAASRRRRVVFLHGIEAWRSHDALTRMLLKRTDLFLTNSEYTWRRFLGSHPECARAAHGVVHLGLGEPLGELAARPSGGAAEGGAALMIGRLSRKENYKGHREMIQVWPRVAARLPGAELWIVGDGDLRPDLERLAEDLAVGDQVVFFGAVPDGKKEELLRRCRALVMPSSGEGFGLVYVEAMRMGRPCLVSAGGAGVEVVNPPEAGLAVDVRETSGVVEALVRLLRRGGDAEEMGMRARVRYEGNYTARHFGDRLMGALFPA